MINQHGFLSPDMAQHALRIRGEHPRLFEIAARVNEIMVTTVSGARLNLKVDQQRCAAGLFLRTLELFQAAVLLAERGIVAPAKSHVRSLMEVAYALTILEAEPEFVRELEVSAARARKTHLEKVLEPLPESEGTEDLTEEDRANYRAQIREIDVFIQERGGAGKKPKGLEPRDLAARAEALGMHRVVYPSGSAAIHVNLQDIFESYADDLNTPQLSFGPTSRGVDQILSQGIHFATSAFEKHERIFRHEFNESSEVVRLWHEAMGIPLQRPSTQAC